MAGQLKVNGVTLATEESGTVTLEAPQIKDSSNNVILDQSGTNPVLKNVEVVNNSSMMFRNKIINGDMRIDQRNAGASLNITILNGQYTIDRWNVNTNQASKVSVQQSTTVPAGFKNSALITSLSTFSPGSGDYFGFVQYVEGFNAADFAWGTDNAQAATLSFRVRASITGTYTVAIGNSAGARSYVATFTVDSVNTYETKTITIAGDTSGTWLTDSGRGLRMWFDLGSGSTFNQASANTWTSSNTLRTSGSVSLIGTSGATFYITGVQLEVGTVATPFEHRPYGMELSLCQRYYELGTFDCRTYSATASANFVYVHNVLVPKRTGSYTPAFISAASVQNNITGTPSIVVLTNSQLRMNFQSVASGDTYYVRNFELPNEL